MREASLVRPSSLIALLVRSLLLVGKRDHPDAEKKHGGTWDKTPKEALHPAPQVHKIGDNDVYAQPCFEFIGRDRFKQRSARIEFADLASDEDKQDDSGAP